MKKIFCFLMVLSTVTSYASIRCDGVGNNVIVILDEEANTLTVSGRAGKQAHEGRVENLEDHFGFATETTPPSTFVSAELNLNGDDSRISLTMRGSRQMVDLNIRCSE
jgi:hypothetical protein